MTHTTPYIAMYSAYQTQATLCLTTSTVDIEDIGAQRY